ncbi:MAG: TlyA family RNA methyltransferase [Candidatus Humimicrobiaceae bacterium]
MSDKNSKNKKTILNLLLSNKNISSEKVANAYILAGSVTADGVLIDKPGTLVTADCVIKIKEIKKYVSRGAIKLEEAIRDFKIDLSNKTAIDFGASTGGFTDYLIKNQVTKIIAVDIGYGQFAWELRNNNNIFLLERTNIKNIETSMLPFIPDLAVADLSFISIRKIFYKIFQLTNINAELLLLIKPQFELEKDLVENKGVIKNINLHIKALSDVVEFFKIYPGIKIKGINFSKIKGAKGNIEYWIYLQKINQDNKGKKDLSYDKMVKDIAKKSHEFFFTKLNNI